jgi:hypothetical protein
MNEFSREQLQARSFHRVAMALHHFWEEQQHDTARAARVHTRIFDTLVPEHLIYLGRSGIDACYREHLVPCVYIRDLAFDMFWAGKSLENVAQMIGRLLRVAKITKEEANRIDHKLKLKVRMPADWNPETGSILARLDAAEIRIQAEITKVGVRSCNQTNQQKQWGQSHLF